MGKTSSKSKGISPAHKSSSKFKVSPAASLNTPKIIINICIPASKRGGTEGEVEEEEMVTYLFLTEVEEHKIERRLSERISPKRNKRTGTFMTQDEGESYMRLYDRHLGPVVLSFVRRLSSRRV